MPLPTVLMTDVIRSTKQGDSHGGAYLVDLEQRSFDKVLDWNTMDIDWEGRGSGRGLRGIAFHGDEIYIAASDELCVFDRSFNLLRTHQNQYLRHIHEGFLEGDRLFLISTSYNAVLEFDIAKGAFVSGFWLDAEAKAQGPDGKKTATITPHTFDPNAPGGPERGDQMHLNMVWRHNGHTLVSGLRTPVQLAFDGTTLTPTARLPWFTHNCRPFGNGTLYHATKDDAVVVSTRDGRVARRYELPRYDEAKLEHADVPDDYARQAFGRGLCVSDDGLIIAGSSPSTVTAYDPKTCQPLASVNVTMDVRNCPHGLEIWPY
ncbi:MAG: hypothetical protein DHS20C14_04980 [Phycisphaeraceae bacterium]|nr:MAG: hypothetical protein DHS20C14_04980 [Phycisphaeraceae bacterium]